MAISPAPPDFWSSFAQNVVGPGGPINAINEDIAERRKFKLQMAMQSSAIEQQMQAKMAEERQAEQIKQSVEQERYRREGFATPQSSAFVAKELGIVPPQSGKYSLDEFKELVDLLGKREAEKASKVTEIPEVDQESGLRRGWTKVNGLGNQVGGRADPQFKQAYTSWQRDRQVLQDLLQLHELHNQLAGNWKSYGKGWTVAGKLGNFMKEYAPQFNEYNSLRKRAIPLAMQALENVPGSRVGQRMLESFGGGTVPAIETDPTIADNLLTNAMYQIWAKDKYMGANSDPSLDVMFSSGPKTKEGMPKMNVLFKGGAFEEIKSEPLKSKEPKQQVVNAYAGMTTEEKLELYLKKKAEEKKRKEQEAKNGTQR